MKPPKELEYNSLKEITQKRLDEINVALQLQLTLAAVNYLAFADWPCGPPSLSAKTDRSPRSSCKMAH